MVVVTVFYIGEKVILTPQILKFEPAASSMIGRIGEITNFFTNANPCLYEVTLPECNIRCRYQWLERLGDKIESGTEITVTCLEEPRKGVITGFNNALYEVTLNDTEIIYVNRKQFITFQPVDTKKLDSKNILDLLLKGDENNG